MLADLSLGHRLLGREQCRLDHPGAFGRDDHAART
jgi:hypothetical protein